MEEQRKKVFVDWWQLWALKVSNSQRIVIFRGNLMRSRNIKPNFFKNESLASISCFGRLLFIGLWCLADREGRLEKRPLRIKAEIFPYDSLDINRELTVLEREGFIKTYEVSGVLYLHIPKFKMHQSPHHTEAKSKLPDISDGCAVSVNSPLNLREYPPDSLIPDSLIPDSLIPDLKPLVEYSTEFETFWKHYPKKKNKDEAYKAWKKIKRPAETLMEIINALQVQKKSNDWTKQNGQFIPYPSSYLNGGGWKDETTSLEDESWRII